MRLPMPKSTRFPFGAIAVALILAIPGPAWAQEDEIFVDPNSPAGTEYELPLDRAREEAGGGGAGGSSGGGSGAGAATGEAPLFGEGVERAASGSARDGGATRSAGTSTGSGEPDDRAAITPPAVHAQAPSPDDGGGALLAVAAGAAGVLLLGGLAGMLWRRRSPVGG